MSPLPIDALIPGIVSAVKKNLNLILTATPGAGKTTRLPPELLSCVLGKVIVLQPRRMAAVSACERVAEERGWRVGTEVGYQVRFESRVSSSTRLIFMTDALLLRRMIDDPELNGVDLVVLDEFHERVAKLIVHLTFFFVAQHIVGFGDFFKAIFRRFVVRIFIRMKFHRELAKSFFKIVRGGLPRNTKNTVVIFFRRQSLRVLKFAVLINYIFNSR